MILSPKLGSELREPPPPARRLSAVPDAPEAYAGAVL